MSGRALRLAAAVALAASCACGGGGSGGQRTPGGTEVPHGTVSVEDRLAMLAALHVELASLDRQGLSGAPRAAAIAEWLGARPEVFSSGVDADASTAWAVFQDGRALVVADDWNPIPAAAAPGGPTAVVARRGVTGSGPATAATTELPTQARAQLVHSFGAGFDQLQAPVDQMKGSLAEAGYALAPGADGDASLDVLRAVSGSGFFYLNTHGGKHQTSGGTTVFSAQSSTVVTAEREAQPAIEDDFAHGRIVYFSARNGDTNPDGSAKRDTRYGITAAFVQSYMSFGENSIVLLNVCWSAFAHASVDAFVSAVQQKGASVYFGWSRAVDADFALVAAQFLVDRLLGANAFRPETPKQRPFEWPSVLADMKRKGLAVDPNGAELVAKPAPQSGPGAGLLAPSIAMLFVDESSDALHVGGTFGEDPGAAGVVTIAGPQGTVSLAVLSWSPNEIVADLPASSATAAGDVVVSVRGVPSNPRRLVAWNGTLRYTRDDGGSLAQTVALDLGIRLDPEDLRFQAGDAPQPSPLATSQYPGNVAARYAATGTYQASDGTCTYTTAWSGSGSVPAAPPASLTHYFYAAVADRAARTMTVTVTFEAADAMTVTSATVCPDGSSTSTWTQPIVLADEIFDAPGTMEFVLPLDATLGVVAAQRQRATDSLADAGTATAQIAWDAIPAVPPVDGTLPL